MTAIAGEAGVDTASAAQRCGLIAIVGRPNVGKSTLLNALVGQKVSITSAKAQTTRHRITGIRTRGVSQFVFVDTPGFQTKHSAALNRTLNRTVTGVLGDVDVVLFVVEAGRFGLDDAILIKDNHIALAGDVRTAIERAKANAGHLVKIEVEVDTLSQLEQVLALGVDAVLLDNMTTDQLRQAVAMTGGRAVTEASGRITVATAKAIAETGVDLISAGWLTHSSAALDIGLDYLELNRQAA